MVLPPTERRLISRVSTRLPVSLRQGAEPGATQGYTRDLSSSGIFLYTQSEVREGSLLELVLMLPAQLTQGEKRWVCCQASVVRVEGSAENSGFGVAASIRSMEILPEIEP
jgi:hypothetical protein